ncbi:MAG: hypothetical protein V8Q39_06100 [Anaerovoracaceae bacterium]
MANKHSTLSDLFTAIADAIRSKTGSSDGIIADDFPKKIEEIESGWKGKYVIAEIPDSVLQSETDFNYSVISEYINQNTLVVVYSDSGSIIGYGSVGQGGFSFSSSYMSLIYDESANKLNLVPDDSYVYAGAAKVIIANYNNTNIYPVYTSTNKAIYNDIIINNDGTGELDIKLPSVTATASDIAKGKTAITNDGKVTGKGTSKTASLYLYKYTLQPNSFTTVDIMASSPSTYSPGTIMVDKTNKLVAYITKRRLRIILQKEKQLLLLLILNLFQTICNLMESYVKT